MRCRALFLIACLAAAVSPLIPVKGESNPADDSLPGWPKTFEGRRLTRLDISPREDGFTKSFPGRIAKFTDGRRTILIRWVTRRTRKLHPAADCFKGIGYTVRPSPLHTDRSGNRWGGAICSRGGETLKIRERINDAFGRGWTDVSSWHWAALLGKTSGPWRAVTIVEKVRPASE
jgi:hypothetical protein